MCAEIIQIRAFTASYASCARVVYVAIYIYNSSRLWLRIQEWGEADNEGEDFVAATRPPARMMVRSISYIRKEITLYRINSDDDSLIRRALDNAKLIKPIANKV